MVGFLPGGIGYGRPAGIPDGSEVAVNNGGLFGGASSGGGTGWQSALGILGAGLQDAGSYFSGHPADANHIYQQQEYQRQIAQYNALQQAKQGILSAGSDPDAMRAALMQYGLAGGDPSNVIAAQSYGKHVIQAHPKTDNLYDVDPMTGKGTLLQSGQTTPPAGFQWNTDGSALQPIPGGPAGLPQLPRGFQWADQGHTTMAPVPGYTQGAGQLSAARRAPPKAGGASGAIAIPHPGSLY